MSALARPPQTPRAAQENIEKVIQLEEDASQSRSLADKLADAIANFVGSIPFVIIHIGVLAAWVATNLGLIPGVKPFDPYPFQLLCMIVSIEGVLLSTFVLIKQNRMSQQADYRAHLDLQVNLLTEKEVTKLLQAVERLSSKMGVDQVVQDPEIQELGQVTAVENLAKDLEQRLPK